MNSPIDRLRSIPTRDPSAPLRQPDIFERCIFAVKEIALVFETSRAYTTALAAAIDAKDIDMLDRATAEIGELLEQANNLNKCMVAQIAKLKGEQK